MSPPGRRSWAGLHHHGAEPVSLRSPMTLLQGPATGPSGKHQGAPMFLYNLALELWGPSSSGGLGPMSNAGSGPGERAYCVRGWGQHVVPVLLSCVAGIIPCLPAGPVPSALWCMGLRTRVPQLVPHVSRAAPWLPCCSNAPQQRSVGYWGARRWTVSPPIHHGSRGTAATAHPSRAAPAPPPP